MKALKAYTTAGLDRSGSEDVVRIGLLVVDDFPMAPLSMVIEALRLANSLEGKSTFTYLLVSADGRDRTSSCGFPAPVSHSVNDCPPSDVVLVCAGSSAFKNGDESTVRWLRAQHRRGAQVGGISSGSLILARAGLLEGRSCAVHWATAEALREKYQNVTVSGDIFCIDGRIITCAGGISTLDLMLHLIEHFRGRPFARRVADDLIYPFIRGGHEPARMGLKLRTGVSNNTLLRAVELMELQLEEPMTVTDVAARLETSVRHLERLFLRSFSQTPSQYYMSLRLSKARDLLTQTDIPLIEVALRCGFRNTSHFARRYREIFKIAPSHQRRLPV